MNSSEGSGRRGFVLKLVAATASVGVAGLTLDRFMGRSAAQSPVNLAIDSSNTGSSTTSLSSPGNPALTATNTGSGAALQGTCTAGTGVLGTTTTGTGVQGVASDSGGTALAGFAGNPSAIPIVAQGDSGQSANLQEWRDSSGALSVVDASGNLGVGTAAPATALHIYKPVSSNPAIRIENENQHVGQFIYCFSDGSIPFFSGRRARGTMAAPAAVQAGDTLMRYGGSGYGSTSFPGGNRAILEFRAAETWTDSSQGTYISIQTTPTGGSTTAAERMRITDTGDIIPPSDISGNIGTTSNRWALVRAKTITSGDLTFENGYRVTEDIESGLSFMNQRGEQIARLDEQGNFHIKGKLIEDL